MPKSVEEIITEILKEMRDTVSGLISFGISRGSYRPHDGLFRARGLFEALTWREQDILARDYPITYRVVSTQNLRIQDLDELTRELGIYR